MWSSIVMLVYQRVQDIRSGKNPSVVLLYLTFRLFGDSHISSPHSPGMNVQVPKSAMFGSVLHFHLHILLTFTKIREQNCQQHGWGGGFPMDFPWISHGFPMDFPWISHGFPMDFPWICRYALSSASGWNRSWRNWKPIQRTRYCPMRSPRRPTGSAQGIYNSNPMCRVTYRIHTHTHVYIRIYIYMCV